MATGLFNLKQVNQAISQGAWSGYIAPKWVEYLVVAGGGGGGSNAAGGGGGGGLLTGIVTVSAGTSYTVTVGGGGSGAGAGSTSVGGSGVSSVFGSISTTGGGGGGPNTNVTTGVGGAGGSGGGNGEGSGLAQGVAGQGNAGGFAYDAGAVYGAGGGGGAGTIGLSGTSSAGGNGGAGIASAINGTVTTYAGGGGGASQTTGGSGGVGGGGAATTGAGAGTAGTTNTGGGGGASSNAFSGANGGSGIVVVRYPGSIQFFTGGTLSYANGYMIHTFYASGTLAPTTPTPYVTDYQISRSLRFNSADSAYLGRTPTTASNRKTWTWSGWVKRTKLGVRQGLFTCLSGTGLQFGFLDTDVFQMGTNAVYVLQSTQVFRDPSAWYHIVVTVNTTLASNRCSVYINGTQITAWGLNTFDSTFAQNSDTSINLNADHALGQIGTNSSYLDGYMTEVNLIDGQALTPSSFGYTDPDTGVWSPLAFVGTYGTNGFYLNFSDNSNTTAATLGKDYSGNGNNWIPFNFSVTAGAGNDSLVDSPTSYGTDTGVGGEVRGNYCTFNPLVARWDVNTASITNGNLDTADTVGDANNPYVFGTTSVSSGKFYWEITVTAIGTSAASFFIGVDSGKTQNGATFTDWVGYCGNGQKFIAGSGSSYGATYTTGDVIGVALDKDAGTVTFYKNNASQGAISLPTNVPMVAWLSPGSNSSSATGNFGQRPFAYTAPSGYKALCTQNLPTPTIGATTATQAGKYFNPVTYTGNGTNGRAVTGVGFQPDLVWVKERSGVTNNVLNDVIRGGSRGLFSNNNEAEYYDPSSFVQSFNSDGFTVGSTGGVNSNTATYVGWSWKANGSGSTNTAGSITSTISVNTTSGFSIVTYTGTGANATVGHGLGVAPSLIFGRSRTTAGGWPVYSAFVSNPTNSYLVLNTTDAVGTASNYWGTSAPTSTTFSVSTYDGNNKSGDAFVMYCFAPVAGYSAFGSYTGNGSADGPFVFTGFRPAYVMFKRTDVSGENWQIRDAVRDTYNVVNKNLRANLSDAETTFDTMDMVSNGFKLRSNDSGINGSGGTYIYMAFATSPFKYSLAR